MALDGSALQSGFPTFPFGCLLASVFFSFSYWYSNYLYVTLLETVLEYLDVLGFFGFLILIYPGVLVWELY